MKNLEIHNIVNIFISTVWLVNGLFCKVLNFVPRHEHIVSRIMGTQHSSSLTLLIGLAEIGMAVWILSGFRSKTNAILQIVIVLTMNCIEYMLAPDLLLWGKLNIVFALLFTLIVYLNAFVFHKLKPAL